MLPKASYRLVGYKLQVINLDFRLKKLKTGTQGFVYSKIIQSKII